ncbi:MAG: hypothetical protein Q8P02_03985, partial [Candidatus Micrarchaeota archaeon]|nr:hypothetical protein [Candidatus Micrarchaeota archaeon]
PPKILGLLRGKQGNLYVVFNLEITVQGSTQYVGSKFLKYSDTRPTWEAYHVDYEDAPGFYSVGTNYYAISGCSYFSANTCYLPGTDKKVSVYSGTPVSAPVYDTAQCGRNSVTCGYYSPPPYNPFCNEQSGQISLICPDDSVPFDDSSGDYHDEPEYYQSCFIRKAEYSDIQVQTESQTRRYSVVAVAVSKDGGRTWKYLGEQTLPQPVNAQIRLITTGSDSPRFVYAYENSVVRTAFRGAAVAPESGIFVFYDLRQERVNGYGQYDRHGIDGCTVSSAGGISTYSGSNCVLDGLPTKQVAWESDDAHVLKVTPDGMTDVVVASKLRPSGTAMQNLAFVGSRNDDYYFCLSKESTVPSFADGCDASGPEFYVSRGLPTAVTAADLGTKLERIGYFGIPSTSGTTYDTRVSALVAPDGRAFARKTGNPAFFALRNGAFTKLLSLPDANARTVFDSQGNLHYTYYVGTSSSPDVTLHYGRIPAAVLSGADPAPYTAQPELVGAYRRPPRSGSPAYTSHLYPSLYVTSEDAPAILVEDDAKQILQYNKTDDVWNARALFALERQTDINFAFVGPSLGQSEEKISMLVPAYFNKAQTLSTTNACGESQSQIVSQNIVDYDVYSVKKSLIDDEPTQANALSELVPYQHYRVELPVQPETAPTVTLEANPAIVRLQTVRDPSGAWYADVTVDARDRFAGGRLDFDVLTGTITAKSGEKISSDTPLRTLVRHVVATDLAYAAPEKLVFYQSGTRAVKKQIALVNNYPRTVTLSCGSVFSQSMPANSIKFLDVSAQNAACKVAVDGRDTLRELVFQAKQLPDGLTYWARQDVLAERSDKIEQPVTFHDAASTTLNCFQSQQALHSFESLVATHVEHINAQPGSTVSELYPNGFTEKMMLRTGAFDDLDEGRLGECPVVFGGFDVPLQPGQVYEMALKIPRAQNWLSFDARTVSLPKALLPQWSYATPDGVKSDENKFIEMNGVT